MAHETRRAVVLVGHGSRVSGSSEALNQITESLRKAEPDTIFEVAFLEIATPSIMEGIGYCVKKGAEEVVLLPYFLQVGNHVSRDLPAIQAEASEAYPHLKIRLAEHLGFDERIAQVVRKRIDQARGSL